jgi:hypothetical protein
VKTSQLTSAYIQVSVLSRARAFAGRRCTPPYGGMRE